MGTPDGGYPTVRNPKVTHGPGWVRVLGYGVRHVDHRQQRPLFSERNGYRRVLHVGPHCFAWLRPDGHRHLIGRHAHPGWLGHSDPTKRGYKPADRPHWHAWWRHDHAEDDR